MTLPSQLKNIEWDTYSCHFGWAVQGIWPPISKIQTSPEPTCVTRSHDHSLLAVGFSNGEVRLYQYPCICISNEADHYRVEKLHVGPVSRCSFNHNSSLLLTLGKLENGIAVWRLNKGT